MSTAPHRTRKAFRRRVTGLALGLAAVLLWASPAVAIPVDPGGGGDDPPPDCVAATTATLTVSPSPVLVGQSVTVSWSIDQIIGCTVFKWINGAGLNGVPISNTGFRTVQLNTVGTQNWSLQVSGSAGHTYTLASDSTIVVAPPPATSPVAAAMDANGRMQIIQARDDGAILRDAQIWPGQRFSGWTAVPGQLRSVASEIDGSHRTVQVGYNNLGQIWGAIQNEPGGTGWTNWTAIDGTVSSLALARNADGRLEMFATNSAGTIFHRRQNAVGTLSFGSWSTFPGALSQMAAETYPDGRIEVVGVNSAGNIYRQNQIAANGTTWTGWTLVDGTLASVALTATDVGNLELFGTAPNGELQMRIAAFPNGGDYGNGHFVIPDGHGGPVAAETNADGRVVIFGRDSAGVPSYRTETRPHSAIYTAWQPLIQYRVGPGPGAKRKLLVIPVSWAPGGGTPASPPSKSLNDVIGMIDNPWWAEVSYGQFPGWDIRTYGPLVIQPPRLDGSCGQDFLRDIALQAEDQAIHGGGIDVSEYTVLYWFTGIDNCSWGGAYQAGRVYINGGGENTINHELGHFLGLDHASGWNCVDGAGNRVTWSGNCTRLEYGDPNDTMGAAGASGFNALERDRLGWMSGRITDVPAGGGSYTLSPLELTTPGLQAVRLSDGTPLWIEYREEIGIDTGKVHIPAVRIYAPYPSGSGLLDLAPETATFADADLVTGRTWISPTRNYKVTVDWTNSIGAHITISLNRANVPNVVNMNVVSAQAALQAAGFSFVQHDVVDITCTKLDKVSGQSPGGGSQAIPGTTVTLDVYVAPPAPAQCA